MYRFYECRALRYSRLSLARHKATTALITFSNTSLLTSLVYVIQSLFVVNAMHPVATLVDQSFVDAFLDIKENEFESDPR